MLTIVKPYLSTNKQLHYITLLKMVDKTPVWYKDILGGFTLGKETFASRNFREEIAKSFNVSFNVKKKSH